MNACVALLCSAFLTVPLRCAAPADDPLGWLDDGGSEPVRGWTRSHDQAARQALASRPDRAALRRSLEAALPPGAVQGLAVYGRRAFYLKRTASARGPSLFVREVSAGEPRLVVDADRLSLDGSAVLAWWQPSADGLLLAYGVTRPETGEVELRVREVDSGTDLPDRITRVPEACVGWLPDRSGFYYSRLPDPAALSAPPPLRRVFFHVIGTDPSRDSLFYTARDPEERPEIRVTSDAGLLVLFARRGSRPCELFVQDRSAKAPRLSPVTGGGDGACRGILEKRTLYLLGDSPPHGGRVTTVDLSDPRSPRWRGLVPEIPFRVSDFALVPGGLAFSVVEHATSRLQLYDRQGQPWRELPIPGQGSVRSLAADPRHAGLLFIWESFLTPPALYRYDVSAASLTALDSAPGPEPDEFKLERVDYPAPDGSPAPMFLVSGRWLRRDGERPTILAGASGGLAAPAFSPLLVSWIRRGGLWAEPARPGSAADLVAAGRWLVQSQFTRSGRLAVLGRGPGTLLAAAAAAQAPELFAAAVLEQPFAELRPDHLPPPALILAGPCPSGPDPAHSRRLAAAWERAGGATLLRWEPSGCPELSWSRRLEAQTDIQAFLDWKLGLEPPQTPASPPTPKRAPPRRR